MGAALRDDYYFGEPTGETTLKEFTEYCVRPENRDKSFELVDGYIVMIAGNTTFNHQRISGYIARKFGNYLEGKRCEVFTDMKVHLFSKNIGKCKDSFQPDIMVICDKDKAVGTAYEGTPDFIAEIVSPSSSRMDYIIKCDAYMRFNVKEYWIIDMFQKQIIINLNNFDGTYKILSYTFDDTVRVFTFDNLSIDFTEISGIIQ